MYEHFFNLTAEPFRLSPDHRFCYNHEQYAKAKAYMAYAFMRAEGFVMVTGQPGTGKTTLIGDLVESLADENVAVANLVSTQLAADDLLRMVAFAFGITTEAADKSQVLQQLNARFLSLHRAGGRALLIVDEAQDLTHMAMEELRLLTNLQLDGSPLLQIFLLGQPELRELIHDPALEQVHQRIIATSNLRALKEDETRAYVEHRLHVVGWQNDPAISLPVFPIIYQFSQGVPRRINLICSRLFLHTFVEQRHQIGVADARTVVEELQEEQLSTRNMLNDELFFAEDSYESPLAEEGLLPATSERMVAESAKEADYEPAVFPDSADLNESSEGEVAHQEDLSEAETPPTADIEPLAAVRRELPEEQVLPAGSSNTGLSGGVREARSFISIEAWITLFAALAAAGLVALLVGIDTIL
tara:strand:+ start:112140 stop:113387 length:1248 start_codon:yes stop_codon:yes gene_type:complete